MKGIVFNLLEKAVSDEYGEDAWDEALETANLDGSYTSLGNYSDQEFFALVEACSAKSGESRQDVIRWFGRTALPMLAVTYPQLFEPHTSARDFVLTLNDIIHPEVRKLYPGADVPVFDFDVSDEDVVKIGYSSPRKLCAFGEGLIQGTANHYRESVHIDQPMCMHRGDSKCLLEIRFAAMT